MVLPVSGDADLKWMKLTSSQIAKSYFITLHNTHFSRLANFCYVAVENILLVEFNVFCACPGDS